ncbi:MAG: hypothetical protein IT503_02680 [Burkholderiaceae bacterium]|nr:hypothetical protein [Burkholderiaceae bacterium]
MTIDLRGIGGAARAAARTRGIPLALLARQALIAAVPGDGLGASPRAETSFQPGRTTKLSVRLSAADSATLTAQAAALGLSQARLVALMIRRAELPLPVAERRAELAALRTSNDQLAAIASDVALFVRALSRPSLAALAPFRQRMLNLDADIAQHLRLAAALLARVD